MKQKIKCGGLVLRSRKTGENHRFVTLMTDDYGLVSAKIFGAASRKSRSGTGAMPFAAGSADLEHDTVADYWQLKEFTPVNQFENIRSELSKFYTANLWAEVVLALYGGASESKDLFHLLFMALTALNEGEDKSDSQYTGIQFLARYLYGSGFLPGLYHCSSCSRKLDSRSGINLDSSGSSFCNSCFSESSVRINPGIGNYLRTTIVLPLENVYRYTLSESAREEALHFLYRIVQNLIGHPLKTLESSGGFL